MAKKKIENFSRSTDIPSDITGHMFYGLKLDESQIAFVNAMLNKENIGVFCNARAGTGKTLLSVATAKMLIESGRYDRAFYIVAPVNKDKTGFLPGSVSDKISPTVAPLFNALITIGEQPGDIFNEEGNSWIVAKSHDFDRGANYERSVVIIDEAQNFYIDELRKELTRLHDDCLCVVIGHTLQCDLYSRPEHSGFSRYLDEANKMIQSGKGDFLSICELTTNHRGRFSTWADMEF